MSVTLTFTFTGSPQNFEVPMGVTQVQAHVVGGSGGGIDGQQRSFAGFVDGIIPVTPGETLTIIVADLGTDGSNTTSLPAGGYGDGNGGNGAFDDQGSAGSGGGASSILRLSARLLTGGGGGGAGNPNHMTPRAGGDGGSPGQNGAGSIPPAGQGGTNTTPGQGGGAVSGATSADFLGNGGQGGKRAQNLGGGGGGGTFGGGGAGATIDETGGGGGGANFADLSVQNVAQGTMTVTGPGVITLTFTPASPITLTTQVSASSIFLGEAFRDTAQLVGGESPTGTLTFYLFDECAIQSLMTSVILVSGEGFYSTPIFYPTCIGKYRFIVQYSGDENNSAISLPVSDSETVLVKPNVNFGCKLKRTSQKHP